MPYGGGGAMGANPYGGRRTPRPNTPNTYNPVANQNKPGTNPRVDWLDQNLPEWRNTPGGHQTAIANSLWGPTTGYNNPSFPSSGGGGGGGGGRGGGGGGGGGAAGLDQATLDWLMGAVGRGAPTDVAFRPIDLADPSQYYQPFDTSAYDTARAGVAQGIADMRTRAGTAYDAAGAELAQFKNPYAQGAWAQNPDIASRFNAMFAANNAPTSLMDETRNEGIQADSAFGNVQALMAGNEQARQAANLRALAGDRRMTDLNLGLEGNTLNLGVNTAQGKAKSAYDQMLADARYQADQQERLANWQRENQVSDTNAGARNTWNQDMLSTLLGIVGQRAPGTTLPDLATLFGQPAVAPAAGGSMRPPGTGPGLPRQTMPGAAPGVPFGAGPGGGGVFTIGRPAPAGTYKPKRG